MKTNVDISSSKVKLFKLLFLMASASIMPLVICFLYIGINPIIIVCVVLFNLILSGIFLNKIAKHSENLKFYINRAAKYQK